MAKSTTTVRKTVAKKAVKKTASKKSVAKKAVKKAAVKRTTKKTGARPIKRSTRKASAGSVEVVRPPLVDVTPEVQKDVVIVKPEPKQKVEKTAVPAETHETFSKELNQEPEKKGFFSRLFGK